MRKDWLKDPSNRILIKQQRAEWKKKRAALRKRQEEWAQGGLFHQGVSASMAGSNASLPDKSTLDHSESFQPDMGWGTSWASDDNMPDGISRRYPFARFDAKEIAETACEALQRQVGELARAALSKNPFNDIDNLFASANPRFFHLAESQLSSAENIHAHSQIARLFEPVGNGVTWEEGVLCVFLPEIRPTLDLLRADEPKQPTCSEDFTSVCWFGTSYQFSKGLQAQSVRFLFEAWKNKTPTLSEKTIGDRVESASDNFQLAKVFREKKKKHGGYEQHPAWGTMIQRAGKGTYQLVEPQKKEKDQES